VQSLLSISLERSSLSFGQVRTGTTPAPLSKAITISGNVAAGYSLAVHRSAFAPADLPLGIASSLLIPAAIGAVVVVIESGAFVRFGELYEGYLPGRSWAGEYVNLDPLGVAIVAARSGHRLQL